MDDDALPRLLYLSSLLDQLLSGADAILEGPMYVGINVMAEELRETIVDMQAEVESHLEEYKYGDG
jgi:hypothetical protein